MTFDTPVSQLNRVGKTTEKHLQRLGIFTVRDLLFHFPFRYEDFRSVRLISELHDEENATILVTIEVIASKRSRRKRMMVTEAVVRDENGSLRLVWFGQPFIAHTLKIGDQVYFSGRVKRDRLGLTMTNPSFEKKREGISTTHTARLVPLYSLTSGVTQKQIRSLIASVIDEAKTIEEWIPNSVRQLANVIPLPEALHSIHFPDTDVALRSAERRLKFGELFLLQLKAERLRRERLEARAPVIQFPEVAVRAFVQSLPYTLTKDQKIAAWEILKDIAGETPMNRLLQGDVGCGKTVVAGIAAYAATVQGFRTIIMAPTEILASQHYETLRQLFQHTDVVVGCMTRSRKEMNHGNVIVGTHALLEDDVLVENVGLVIVDEQHRFGVLHRKRIRGLAHFLSMTATPIPRSLALTIYGDLDISIIRTMPEGRKPVRTRVVAPNNRDRAYEFIRAEIQKGRQAFVVCPLIDKNLEASNKVAVLSEYKKLSENIFSDLRVGFLHGKLKSKEKEETMRAFTAGKIDILVSTSVVEVGVDVPNATVMMIEGAEHFGLAQLHQFRGRVGRSSYASYCFLFQEAGGNAAEERLAFFEKTIDGFRLAEYDLAIRGPGEVYGKEQSGLMQLRIATMRDVELIRLARSLARDIDVTQYPELRKKISRFEQSVHLE